MMTKERFISGGKQGINLKAIKPTKFSSIDKVTDHQLDQVKGLSPEKMAARQKENNEKIEVLPSSNGFPGTEEGFRAFMENVAAGAVFTNIRHPIVQIVVSPSPYNPKLMTKKDVAYINEEIWGALGLSAQQSACVIHTKKRNAKIDGDTPIHWHLNISLVKTNGRAANIHNNVYKLRKLQKRLEREYGLCITPSTATSTQRHNIGGQNRRCKVYSAKLENSVREAWTATKTGEEFKKAMSQIGLVLEKGSLTPVVLRNSKTNAVYNVKNILGARVRVDAVRGRFSDAEYSSLPESKASRRRISKRMRNKIAKVAARRIDIPRKDEPNFYHPVLASAPIGTTITAALLAVGRTEQAAPQTPIIQNPELSAVPARKPRARAEITRLDRPSAATISADYLGRIEAAATVVPGSEKLLQDECDGEISKIHEEATAENERNQREIELAQVYNESLDLEQKWEEERIETENAKKIEQTKQSRIPPPRLPILDAP